jgi:cellulose synthase/poly-beta-1,6-N-acetylglucosamine synthase-like glycosyltransferase
MNTITVDILLSSLAAPVAAACGYLAVLTALSGRPEALASRSPHIRFVVVVPAHDEECGIAATVGSLRAMDYPADLFQIVVVADNCSDQTAARAAEAGAWVLARQDPSRRGKGHALQLAFDRVLGQAWAEALVVVDADTVVSPNLLRAFAARLERGASALQADYAVRDASRAWRPLLLAIAFGAIHSVRSLGRERLGVSAGLHGNGMCFTTKVLREVPYCAFSIVEDLEYGIALGRAGHRVEYVHEARVEGDVPTEARASKSQRLRWEMGRRAMVRAHATKLLRRGLHDPLALDLGIDLVIPPLATIAVVTAAGLLLSLAVSWRLAVPLLASRLWVACALALLAYVLRGWQLSGTGARGLSALLRVPAYMAWKLLLRSRAGSSQASAGEWVRTAREGEAAR